VPVEIFKQGCCLARRQKLDLPAAKARQPRSRARNKRQKAERSLSPLPRQEAERSLSSPPLQQALTPPPLPPSPQPPPAQPQARINHLPPRACTSAFSAAESQRRPQRQPCNGMSTSADGDGNGMSTSADGDDDDEYEFGVLQADTRGCVDGAAHSEGGEDESEESETMFADNELDQNTHSIAFVYDTFNACTPYHLKNSENIWLPSLVKFRENQGI
jgi:hypothetical protein